MEDDVKPNSMLGNRDRPLSTNLINFLCLSGFSETKPTIQGRSTLLQPLKDKIKLLFTRTIH